ncbi:MAG TPA: hypothetical protein PLZ51_15560, partial [Aggregatilineales bacterium]|nr:hypothetical protein [Aggregatilineales bacterium]
MFAAPAFDRIVLLSEVASGSLTLGTYDNLQLTNYFTNSVRVNDLTASNGTVNNLPAGSSLIFTVDPSVKRLVIFRPIDTVRDDIKVVTSGGGACVPTTKVMDSFVIAASMPNQPYTMDLGNCTNVTITKNNTGGRTGVPAIDRIQLLAAEQALGEGTYHPKDLYEYFRGRNGEYPSARAEEGMGMRLLSTTGDAFSFNVVAGIKTVILYRDNYSARDPIRVQTSVCSVPADAKDYNVVATGPDAGPYEPILVNLLSCTRISFTRVPVFAAPVFDRLVLVASLPANLPIGTYDNLDLASYFTGGTLLANTSASDGSWMRLDAGANLTFTVDASVERMLVYRQMDVVRDDLRVQLGGGGGCVPGIVVLETYVGVPIWNQPHVVDL